MRKTRESWIAKIESQIENDRLRVILDVGAGNIVTRNNSDLAQRPSNGCQNFNSDSDGNLIFFGGRPNLAW